MSKTNSNSSSGQRSWLYEEEAIRRQDRLLAEDAAIDLLSNGEYGFLSMVDESGDAYGLPINFAWDGRDSIYLHCAPEGRKLRALRSHSNVSFCVVGRTRVIPDKFTTGYESVVAACEAAVGLPDAERYHALELILDKYSPDDKEIGLKYAEKSFHRTEIIRLDIKSVSGKSKQIGL